MGLVLAALWLCFEENTAELVGQENFSLHWLGQQEFCFAAGVAFFVAFVAQLA